MPTYDYRCDSCDHSFESIRSMSQRDVPTQEPCPSCGVFSVKKLITSPSIHNQSNCVSIKSSSVAGDFKDMMKGVKDYYAPKSRHGR